MTIKTAAISQNGEFITRSMSWTTGSFRKMNNKMPAVKSPAIVNPRPTQSPMSDSAKKKPKIKV